MLLVLVSWLYLASLFTILGAAVLRLGWRGAPGSAPSGFFLPWFGVAVVTLVAGVWSLFDAVAASCHAALVTLAVLSLADSAVRDELRRARRALTEIPLAAWSLILWLGLIVAYAGSDGPAYNLDPGRYHFQNLLWAKSHPVVPGLANLHVRYGNPSSWYVVHAVFDQGPLTNRSYHVLNSFLFFLVLAFGVVSCVRSLTRAPTLSGSAAVVTLLLVSLNYDLIRWLYLSCLTPDLPMNLFVIVGALFALESYEQTGGRPGVSHLCSLAVFVAQAFAVRSSGAFMGVLLLVVAGAAALRQKQLRLVVAPIALGALVALPCLLRSYVLSGWPLFPSTTLGFWAPDWQYPRADMEYFMGVIRRFAFLERRAIDGVVPLPETELASEALVVWLRYQLASGGFLYWYLLAIGLLALGFRFAKHRPALGIELALGGVLATGGWMITAPHLRFGFAYICMSLASAVAFNLYVFRDTRPGLAVVRVIAGVALATSAGMVTLKTAGVSLRQEGLSYPVRVAEVLWAGSFRPLPALPVAPYDIRYVGSQPFHVVRWSRDWVAVGRFVREPLPLRPEPTTDAAGFLLPGPGAAYNATIAIMLWATPLPAVAGIPPALQLRGPHLSDGFRLRSPSGLTREAERP